ncbi:hypothetical protein Hanom_Chr07g00619561 [Helianthus anomalus]
MFLTPRFHRIFLYIRFRPSVGNLKLCHCAHLISNIQINMFPPTRSVNFDLKSFQIRIKTRSVIDIDQISPRNLTRKHMLVKQRLVIRSHHETFTPHITV